MSIEMDQPEFSLASARPSERCTAAMFLSESATTESITALKAAALVESDLWTLSFILFCIDDTGYKDTGEFFRDLLQGKDDPQRIFTILLVVYERSIVLNSDTLDSLLTHPVWFVRLQACRCIVSQGSSTNLTAVLNTIRDEIATSSLEGKILPPLISESSEDYADSSALHRLIDELTEIR